MQNPSQPDGPSGDKKVLFPKPKVSDDEHKRIAAERRAADKKGLNGIYLIAVVAIVIFVTLMIVKR